MDLEQMRLDDELEMKRILESKQEEIDDFIKYCKALGVNLVQENFSYSYRVGLTANSQGIVQRLDPELIVDKDGLIDFDLMRSQGLYSFRNVGYLFGSKFTILASPLYRRGFHPDSNWDSGFLKEFWFYGNESSKCYIALDLDRVRLPNDKSIFFEKDYWFGPKFSDDIASISDGVTRHVVPLDINTAQRLFVFNDAYSIEVKWDTNGNKKTFQLIEFREETMVVETGVGKLHPAKYLHAEFDLNKNVFTHFDGAIQLFDTQEYFQVRDCFFTNSRSAENQVKGKYHKLFKINDMLPIGDWAEFVGLFCSHNPLIYEYFTGELPEFMKNKLEKVRSIGT
ncbi:hypothetical protein O4N82_22610 [Vibrio parahaemolyticus]|uniref:hypothetical protein n=1 Tax=Vibrio parahaemolyticus TaxID=670 RepID=UPI00130311D7|nr:hypothetical protein [Vibrio parahaemolyticus]MCZ6404510.1 hypothetical protein [Vibrio parahaemolyticus]